MKIWAPATSANLGPGFDSMGLALNMGNRVEIVESEVCSMKGQPASITRIEDHLIYQAMVRAWEEMGRKARNIAMSQQDEIPGSRGLGSSAACIAAGVAAANALANLISDEELNENYIIPAAFDPRVGPAVAKAVAEAARATGVARI